MFEQSLELMHSQFTLELFSVQVMSLVSFMYITYLFGYLKTATIHVRQYCKADCTFYTETHCMITVYIANRSDQHHFNHIVDGIITISTYLTRPGWKGPVAHFLCSRPAYPFRAETWWIL